MKTLIYVIQRGIFIILGLAFAGPLIAAIENVPFDRTIVKLHTYSNYAVVVYTTEHINSLSCPGSNKNRMAVIDWSVNKDNKGLLSSALSAKLLGNQVGFTLSDSYCHPWGGGLPVILRVTQ